MFRITVLIAAVLIVVLLPLYEKALNGVLERLKSVTASWRDASEIQTVSEEDILSNKGKWRILIIGYCVFILFMIFALISIITLNTKINNISAATGDILDRLAVLEIND